MRLIQDEFLIGVTGVILNDKDEILLVNHSYRDGEYWSLPGGYIKAKEHPREGLAREIKEETGFIVAVDQEIRIKTDRETARLDISLRGRYKGGTFRPSAEVPEAGFFAIDSLPLVSQNQLMLIQEVVGKNMAPKKTKNSLLQRIRNFFQKS